MSKVSFSTSVATSMRSRGASPAGVAGVIGAAGADGVEAGVPGTWLTFAAGVTVLDAVGTPDAAGDAAGEAGVLAAVGCGKKVAFWPL